MALAHTPAGELLLDPDEAEEAAAAAVVTLAYATHQDLLEQQQGPCNDGGGQPGSGTDAAAPWRRRLSASPGLLTCHTAGRCRLAQYGAALEAGPAACLALAGFMHESLTRQLADGPGR